MPKSSYDGCIVTCDLNPVHHFTKNASILPFLFAADTKKKKFTNEEYRTHIVEGVPQLEGLRQERI